MPKFKYYAKKTTGETVDGIIDAENREDAVDRISRDGCFPVSVDEIIADESRQSDSPIGRIKSRDVTSFSRQMASLLRAGVPLLRGLSVIAEQTHSANMKKMLGRIIAALREGVPFSSALSDYPKVFSPLYIAIARAGEASGTMEDALHRIADYRRKQESVISRVRSALMYPVFMAVVGIGVTVFMLVYVLPNLSGIFEGLGQELPVPTQVVLSVSDALLNNWHWILIGLGAAALLLGTTGRNELRQLVFDRLKLKLPLLGEFFLKVELSRFSRTMEILVRSGIPILTAIKAASSVFGNELIRNELTKTGESLEQGGSFGRSLEQSSLFPSFMINMIVVGEESGRLDESFAEVADAYERDTDETIATSTALMEPLMILIVGSVVGFIVIAMLLPIFEMDMMSGM